MYDCIIIIIIREEEEETGLLKLCPVLTFPTPHNSLMYNTQKLSGTTARGLTMDWQACVNGGEVGWQQMCAALDKNGMVSDFVRTERTYYIHLVSAVVW